MNVMRNKSSAPTCVSTAPWLQWHPCYRRQTAVDQSRTGMRSEPNVKPLMCSFIFTKEVSGFISLL